MNDRVTCAEFQPITRTCSPTGTHDWQSAELGLNLQSGSRSSGKVDKHLCVRECSVHAITKANSKGQQVVFEAGKQTEGTSVGGGGGALQHRSGYLSLQFSDLFHLLTDRSDRRPADHHHRGDIRQSNVGPRVGHPPDLTAGEWREQGAESGPDYATNVRCRPVIF